MHRAVREMLATTFLCHQKVTVLLDDAYIPIGGLVTWSGEMNGRSVVAIVQAADYGSFRSRIRALKNGKILFTFLKSPPGGPDRNHLVKGDDPVRGRCPAISEPIGRCCDDETFLTEVTDGIPGRPVCTPKFVC